MIHAIPSPPPSPRGGMVSRRDPSKTKNGVSSKYKKLLAKYFNEGRRSLSAKELAILKHSLPSDRTK